MIELSTTTYPEGSADIWGYVDSSGNEYAILGTQTATVLLDLADPSSPNQLYRVDGTQTTWRDMKTWEHYIYSICDGCSDGLLIIDVSDPQNPTHKFLNSIADSTTGGEQALSFFHNLYIDEFGYLYAAGGSLNNEGVVIMDVFTDPWNPVIVGYGDPRSSHDIYVRDHIIYSSDIFSGFFSIMDATDKSNVELLAFQNTTGFFTHNAWLSDDGNTLFTTDEIANGSLDAYDISDLNDIKLIDRYLPPSTLEEGVIPHNTHVLNDYLVTSWYTDGLKVIDAQYPDNLIEVASFDSWSGSNGGFNGNWGAYPYLPSGLLLISDISRGLIVLSPTYERPSYLEGNVSDEVTGLNIPGVEIIIEGDKPNLSGTNNFGNYKTGIAADGTFAVRFNHPLYEDTTIMLSLAKDSITLFNLTMKPSFQYVNVLATLIDINGDPIVNEEVTFTSDLAEFSFVSDGAGNIDGTLFDMPYDVVAGLWGFGDTSIFVEDIPDGPLVIQLPGDGKYYVDRFLVDQGWQVDNRAETGDWERGVPVGTDFRGPLNPGTDSPWDIGDQCYGTDLEGTTPFDADVDGVFNILSSPAIALDGNETSINLTFDYWFRGVDTGRGENDSLYVSAALNGENLGSIAIISLSDTAWRQFEGFELLELLDFNAQPGNLQVVYTIGDYPRGNPLEAAVDNIKIDVESVSSTKSVTTVAANIAVFPNPVRDFLTVDLSAYNGNIEQLNILNLAGQVIYTQTNLESLNRIPFDFAAGVYILDLIDINGQRITRKIVR